MRNFTDKFLSLTPAFKSLKPSEFKKRVLDYNFSRYFPDSRESYLLDIGPGRGEMLSLWEGKGYKNILAVDISQEVVDLCRQVTKRSQVDLIDDLKEFLLCHTEGFNLITMIDVIEHLSKKELFSIARPLYNALKSDGILIVQTPNMASPSATLNRYADITHESGFTESSLAQWLSYGGFKSFKFFPHDEPANSVRGHIRKKLRSLYYRWIRFTRLLEHSHNPQILTPVFFAVARKEE